MVAKKDFMSSEKSENLNRKNETSFGKKVFLIAMLLTLVAVLYVLISGNGVAGEIEPTIAKNIFIDVDGDGALDFVTYIEYVPNNPSSIVFPDGQ